MRTIPACMEWPIPDADADVWVWQRGRCAACGERHPLFLDHDHATGLTRGYLCRRCNHLEGVQSRALWWRWRAGWNPATLLGAQEVYHGWGS